MSEFLASLGRFFIFATFLPGVLAYGVLRVLFPDLIQSPSTSQDLLLIYDSVDLVQFCPGLKIELQHANAAINNYMLRLQRPLKKAIKSTESSMDLVSRQTALVISWRR
ncbi:MAG: hypothetical protein QME81_06040 [bacterium]|nr:hypothetical protein [bacterium]